jgi:hypothetical protein
MVRKDISHRLLDMLSVVILTGVAYVALRVTATKYDFGEDITVVTIFIGAVANKLGFRFLHRKVS